MLPGVMYLEDGSLKYRGRNGTITTIAVSVDTSDVTGPLDDGFLCPICKKDPIVSIEDERFAARKAIVFTHADGNDCWWSMMSGVDLSPRVTDLEKENADLRKRLQAATEVAVVDSYRWVEREQLDRAVAEINGVRAELNLMTGVCGRQLCEIERLKRGRR